jgi:hypothetical protein
LQPLLELLQLSKRKCQRNGQSHTEGRKAANDGRQPRDLAQLVPEGAQDAHGMLPSAFQKEARLINVLPLYVVPLRPSSFSGWSTFSSILPSLKGRAWVVMI